MRARLSLLLPLCAALGASCSADPRGLAWELRFADASLEERAVVVDARILRGACEDGESLFETELRLDGRASSNARPPDLSSGLHAFSARARDAQCVVFAEGCTELELPISEGARVQVLLEARSPEPECDDCEDGDCGGDRDAGTGCPPGFADCDDEGGCEADLAASVTCGSCELACTGDTPICDLSGGAPACVGACSGATPTLCDDRCVDLMSDPEHCGDCGADCEPDHAAPLCTGGSCDRGDCAEDWGDCDASRENGCETSLDTETDCGSCGQGCDLPRATSSRCEGGRCVVEECDVGWEDCNGNGPDGCEAELDDDPDNCGDCGVECRLPNADAVCVSGSCGSTIDDCNSHFDDCDAVADNGCETSLRTVTDCGSCGAVCTVGPNAQPDCNDDECEVDCDQGFADCDRLVSTGCESTDATSLNCCGEDCGEDECCDGRCCD